MINMYEIILDYYIQPAINDALDGNCMGNKNEIRHRILWVCYNDNAPLGPRRNGT
jgi:hypothetical protein